MTPKGLNADISAHVPNANHLIATGRRQEIWVVLGYIDRQNWIGWVECLFKVFIRFFLKCFFRSFLQVWKSFFSLEITNLNHRSRLNIPQRRRPIARGGNELIVRVRKLTMWLSKKLTKKKLKINLPKMTYESRPLSSCEPLAKEGEEPGPLRKHRATLSGCCGSGWISFCFFLNLLLTTENIL